jgi:hypothetical protein
MVMANYSREFINFIKKKMKKEHQKIGEYVSYCNTQLATPGAAVLYVIVHSNRRRRIRYDITDRFTF